MRVPLAFALLPAAALAQSNPPPPGIGVDRITLHPGEIKAFTLAPGKEHQLLIPAAAGAKGAVTVHYEAAGKGARVTASSTTGYMLAFTVLADPDGDGGFEPAGDITNLTGDGKSVSREWAISLGTINVGDFVGGPHGDEPHDASGG